MITVDQLAALSRMKTSPEEPVVSLYLSLDLLRSDRRAHRLVLKELIRSLEEQVDDRRAKKALARDLDRIVSFLELEIEPRGRGLVVFSCSSRSFWQIHQLPIPLGDQAYVDTTPYVKPLLNAVDQYPRYGVVVVDKEKARYFVFHLGELIESGEKLDAVPRKHKQGGWSQANFQRHHEAHVLWHLKGTIEELQRYQSSVGFDRLVVGGTDELVAELVRLLPRALSGILAGTFTVATSVPSSKVQREVEAIHNRLDQSRKSRLAEELVVLAKKGGQAVLGVEATVVALNLGQVWRLAIAESRQVPGSVCSNCHRLAYAEVKNCPLCGSQFSPVRDLVGKMVQAALDQDAKVEVLRDQAAMTLAPHGGVGAFLHR